MLFYDFASAMLIPFQCVMLPLVRNMGQLHLLNTPGLILCIRDLDALWQLSCFMDLLKIFHWN